MNVARLPGIDQLGSCLAVSVCHDNAQTSFSASASITGGSTYFLASKELKRKLMPFLAELHEPGISR